MKIKVSNLVFEYQYRDAGNHKIPGRVLLEGPLTTGERALIEAKMESGEFFIAEQVDIPALYEKLFAFSEGPNADDHVWHEFLGFTCLEEPHSGEYITTANARKLYSAFCAVDHWKPDLSPNFK